MKDWNELKAEFYDKFTYQSLNDGHRGVDADADYLFEWFKHELSQPEQQSKNDVPYWVIEHRFFGTEIHYLNIDSKSWNANIHKATKFYDVELARESLKKAYNGHLSEHIDISEPMKEGWSAIEILKKHWLRVVKKEMDDLTLMHMQYCIDAMKEYRNQAIILPDSNNAVNYFSGLNLSDNVEMNILNIKKAMIGFDFAISEIKRLNGIK